MRMFVGGAGLGGWYPSAITSKSFAVSAWNAGFSSRAPIGSAPAVDPARCEAG